jgi:hypothetical protein
VESSCESGNEISGSMKCWKAMEGTTVDGI